MNEAVRPKEFEKIQEFIDDIIFKKKTGENDWPSDVYSFLQELNQMYLHSLSALKAENQLIVESLEKKVGVRDQRIQKLVEEITERKAIIHLDSHRSADKGTRLDDERLDRILGSNESLIEQMGKILRDSEAIIQHSEERAKEIQEKAKWKVVQIEKEGSAKLRQQQDQVNQILKALSKLRMKSNEDMKLILDDLGNLVRQIDYIQGKVERTDPQMDGKVSLPDRRGE